MAVLRLPVMATTAQPMWQCRMPQRLLKAIQRGQVGHLAGQTPVLTMGLNHVHLQLPVSQQSEQEQTNRVIAQLWQAILLIPRSVRMRQTPANTARRMGAATTAQRTPCRVRQR